MLSAGISPSLYSNYDVVPKHIGLAYKALARYDRQPDPLNDTVKGLYRVASSWMEEHFRPYLAGSRVSLPEEVEAWLQPDKSPGYPWTLQYPFKVDYWRSDHRDFFPEYWNALATPDYYTTMCSVSIKEELRSVEKIDSGNVRTIISMDVNHVMAHCMLTLHQNRMLTNTHNQHFISLGMNLFDGEWHQLNCKMTPDNWGYQPLTLFLDGKKFDSRFNGFVFDLICEFRIKMMHSFDRTPDNVRRMWNLYHDLYTSPLVNVDGYVYGRGIGNPSGQACTTPDNSFKNFLDLCVLWQLLVPLKYHSYSYFIDNIVACINGDDINVSVHPRMQDYFNPVSVRGVMSLLDMEYHFEFDVFKYNWDGSYLGHGFSKTLLTSGHSMYLPVIDCEKMRSNLLFYNEQQTLANTIIRVCGLRNETFACVSCRKWFADCYEWLLLTYGKSFDPDVKQAFKSYKTDRELWSLYTGFASYLF